MTRTDSVLMLGSSLVLAVTLAGCGSPAYETEQPAGEATEADAAAPATGDEATEAANPLADTSWRFVELPTRPMRRLDLDPRGLDARALEQRVKVLLRDQPADAVVSVHLLAPPEPGAEQVLRIGSLRRLHPPLQFIEDRLH